MAHEIEVQEAHPGWRQLASPSAKKGAKAEEQGDATPPAPAWVRLPGHSGRAFRFRILSSHELSTIRTQVAAALDKDALVAEYDAKVIAAGAETMLHSYSDPVDPSSLHAAKWHIADSGELAVHDVFTTKDREVIKQLYLTYHHVNGAEIAEILGGVHGVVVDAPRTGTK